MIPDIWGPLKAALKIQNYVIDNTIFRLHYRLTTVFLFASALLVTATQYFGDPIDCIAPKESEKLIDTFCWTHYTFSVVSAFDKEISENGVVYHGIDKKTKDTPIRHHSYYQWVWFVLFFQAGMFYLPRYMWKVWEGGRIKILTEGLSFGGLGGDDKTPKKKLIVDYLTHHNKLHRFFIVKFICCEVANFVNVIGQIYIMDAFLGGEFREFGLKVIQFALEGDNPHRTDPLTKVFPRMTKCEFYLGGSSGNPQKFDAFCILPLNIINEKVFIFSWFWFVVLATLSGLALVYRAVTLISPGMRTYCLKAHCSLADDDCLTAVSNYMQLGDWFMLYLLSKNVEPVFMRDILKEIQERVYDNHRNKHEIEMEKFANKIEHNMTVSKHNLIDDDLGLTHV